MMYPWGSLSSSTSSSSSFACKEVYENQVMDMRDQIRLEREKKRIRAELMAEEEMQRRQLGGWMGLSSSSVMLRPEVISLGGYENRPFNDILYGRSVVVMPTVPDIYSHGDGSHRPREGVDDEPLFQRAPRFREMDVYPTTNDDGKPEILGKGKPCETTSSKRKEPPQPSPPSRAGSIGFGLDSSTATKKSKGEWSCDVCKISATSKNGLNEHLAGKKHQTKMAELKSPNNGGSEIGLGKVKSPVKEQSMEILVTPKENRETKGETAKKRFNPWCRICKVKATSEQDMKKHKEGKQHLKKLLSRERAKNKKNRLTGSKSIGA